MKRTKTKRRNPVPKDFWDTPAGITVQVVAGVGALASIYYLVRNWNSGSAAITAPVAAQVLFAG